MTTHVCKNEDIKKMVKWLIEQQKYFIYKGL